MGEVITYANDKYRCYCQIKLDSGERIFISIAGSLTPSVKISKLSFGGLIPTQTIWEYNPQMAGGYEAYARKLFYMFAEPMSLKQPLDTIRDILLHCKSIDEVRKVILEAEVIGNQCYQKFIRGEDV